MSGVRRLPRDFVLLAVFPLLLASTSSADPDPATVLRGVPCAQADEQPGTREPALASAGGNVQLDYRGSKRFLQITTRTWKDGQWTTTAQDTEPVSTPLDRRVSVLLHDVSRTSREHQFEGIVADRAADQLRTIRFAVERMESSQLARPLELQAAVEVSEDEPLAVWGYAVYTDEVAPGSEGPIEQQAQKAAYAVVVSVRMLDQPAGEAEQEAAASARPQEDDPPGGPPATPEQDDRPAPNGQAIADRAPASRFEVIW